MNPQSNNKFDLDFGRKRLTITGRDWFVLAAVLVIAALIAGAGFALVNYFPAATAALIGWLAK